MLCAAMGSIDHTPAVLPVGSRDVSGVGHRYYAVGQTYAEYGVGRKMVA
jgi:hypothetical protein